MSEENRLSYPLHENYADARIVFQVEGGTPVDNKRCTNCAVGLKRYLEGFGCMTPSGDCSGCSGWSRFKPVVVAKACATCKKFDAKHVIVDVRDNTHDLASIYKAGVYHACANWNFDKAGKCTQHQPLAPVIKVGDRVRIKACSTTDDHVGKTGTITSRHWEWYIVDLDATNGETCNCRAEHVELLPAEPARRAINSDINGGPAKLVYDISKDRDALKIEVLHERNVRESYRVSFEASLAECKALKAKVAGLEKKYATLDYTENLEAQLADMKKQLDDARSGEVAFCPYCGTKNEPKAHVPKWGKMLMQTRCETCRHASRFRAWLQWVLPATIVGYYPCWKRCMAETYDKYKPRISRAERKRVSLAGKIKQLQIDLSNAKYREKEMEKSRKEHRDAADKIIAEKEQKGFEAVAAQYEADLARVKVLKAKLANSVPLANKISCAIRTEKVETKNCSDAQGIRTEMNQVLKVTLRDGEFVHPKDVMLLKKEDVKQP